MSQTGLVKVGLPSHLADGARMAKRVQQILDQRDAAFARIEADFRVRLRNLVTETEEEVSNAVATAAEGSDAFDVPAPA